METYFRVDVLDDHDGGSVWIVHEDFINSFEEASNDAYELSRKRPNKVAKVVKITAEEIFYYENGNGYGGKDY
jgi:hypothetical protein